MKTWTFHRDYLTHEQNHEINLMFEALMSVAGTIFAHADRLVTYVEANQAHGGLLNRDTLLAASELRHELEKVKAK